MLKRALMVLAAVPAGILLVALMVSNRQSAELILDPFRPEQPALSLTMPLYVLLFATLFLGVLVGGVTSWFSQGKWRRTARMRAQDAMRWQAEADRLVRERDQRVASGGVSAAGSASRALATQRHA